MLESVKNRLRSSGQLTPEIERRLAEFERICLSEIAGGALRAALLDYLENHCPLEFFTAPASSSGTRHPQWQSLPGGMLLNTVECCIGADRKIRMYPSLVPDPSAESLGNVHDIVYVATVLTDTFKNGDFGKSWKDWSHHLRAAAQWEEVAKKHAIATPISVSIASAIRWHLGRFTPDWPADRDPRTMDVVDFIVHELDMDFSNRRLSDVFERRLGEKANATPSPFLDKEFDSAASYLQHTEGKLTNLLVFFATLVVAVISASYYIGSGDMFRTLTFCSTPRSFLIGLLLIVFALIALVFVGVYTELRVRKIRMLEEMAAIRNYQIAAAARNGEDIRPAIRMVANVPECPPYLRRPSEDWYTLLLITTSGAAAFAVALPFWTFWAINVREFYSFAHQHLIWFAEGVCAFLVVGYVEFAWFTRFCYQLDLERREKFSPAQYVFFSKHGESFPWPLAMLDRLASWVERSYAEARAKAAGKS